jgi:hypothetical protein
MKELVTYLFALTLISCNSTPSQEKEDHPIDPSQIFIQEESRDPSYPMAASVETSKAEEELEEETVTFYIVVADSGTDYYSLRDQMLYLNKALNIPIDTMRRSFNPVKNLIALPDDDEDDLYAGDYYPRRFPSKHLSLEYLSFYQNRTSEKTIAIVAGIFESPDSADSTVAIIKRINNKAFATPAEIYTGCIH